MRIVIDTNVVASAIFFGGKPRELIERLFNKEVEAYIDEEIALEYSKTTRYLLDKYKNKKIETPVVKIILACKIIKTKSKVKICRDPDDNKFINCAIDSKSLYIVSGDKDLLDIKKFKNVEIVTVSDFLQRYK